MWILWQHLQPTTAVHLFFQTQVNFPCIKQAALLMGDEKGEQKFPNRHFCASFCLLFSGRKNCRFSLQSHRWLSVCSDKPPSARLTDTHTHKHRRTSMHAVPCSLLSPNYSRLEPMLLSLILSVRGLWGNSDISVWCLAYVSRALLGPIKLIFNVCPTLDGPSQGWHSSRWDMISVWLRPHCTRLFAARPVG